MGLKCVNVDQPDGVCDDYKIKFCCPLNSLCHWSQWAEWSSCSKSCESYGVRHRSRRVAYQPDHISSCPGRDYEVESCGTDQCCPVDCEWAQWNEWSACSRDCHGGRRRRTRTKGTLGG